MSSVNIQRLHPSRHQDALNVAINLPVFMEPRFSPYYPNFMAWITHKVVPEFFTSKREVVCAFSQQKIIGVAIIKKPSINEGNAKLCSFFVDEQYRSVGVGRAVMETAINVMNEYCEVSSIITVPEERLRSKEGKIFEGFLSANLFETIAVTNGRYRRDKAEIVFQRSIVSEDIASKGIRKKGRCRGSEVIDFQVASSGCDQRRKTLL